MQEFEASKYTYPNGVVADTDICYHCGAPIGEHFQRQGRFYCDMENIPHSRKPTKEVNHLSIDFRQTWENIKREIEDKPMVVLGVIGAVAYGASNLMDSNTRRVNAKTQRKYQKNWEKEVERRERQSSKKKK